jgi:hypothetical protein
MSDPADRRVHVRLSLDSRYTLRFEVEGRVFRGIEMTNVSSGGLGIKLSHREAVRLRAGMILKGMVFEHPTMPQSKVDGEVRHVMGQTLQNAEGLVLVGIQFHQASEGFLRQVATFITKRLEAAG